MLLTLARPRLAVCTSALALGLAGLSMHVSGQAPAEAAKPAIGAWGVDLTAMDRSVNPGDDFFRFTSGSWMKRTQIPPDRSRWGPFDMLRVKSESDVRAALEDAAKVNPAEGSVERKAVDYYQTYVDTARIDALGLAPAKADLDRIAAARTHEAIVAVAASAEYDGTFPIALGAALDRKRPDVYIMAVAQSGLGMPDRDYYLKDDARFADTRAKYRQYVETMLTLAGFPEAAANADAILAVERQIAELHWPRDKSRDRDLTYNPKSRAELAAFAPEFPLDAWLKAFGTPTQNEYNVVQPDAVQGLARLFRATPVETWRAYLTFHFLNAKASVLPKAFDDAAFEFNGKAITGQPQQRERWKRAVTAMSGPTFSAPMAEAVGQLYVKRSFSPQAKQSIGQLVENLRAAYKARIGQLVWMSEDTRRAALRKLDTIVVKIGYPDRWRDYGSLDVKPGDAFGNKSRENAFTHARDLAHLKNGADRSEWNMAPQTVNAYYNAVWNEIVFPAAILQPPFFDPNADPAVNYGAIGAVIGHEMGHGFDDQGAKSDEKGILRTWWNAEDERRFRVLGDRLAAQYSTFEPVPGAKVNGRLTLGENIGDLGGLNVALEAYKISLQGQPAPVLDAFSGPQRFFLGFGQIWSSLARDEYLRNQVVTDPHSPAEFRANGTVRNMDEWYQAFDIQQGAKLFLAPEQRVRIW